MMPRLIPALIALFLLVACDVTVSPDQRDVPGAQTGPGASPASSQVFVQVVNAVQPVAKQECLRRTTGVNCDFRIIINPNRRAGSNAFQSLDDTGRPMLIFTVALINDVQSPDELAFILSHEAAHHIANHLARQEHNAAASAEVFAELATLTGGSSADVADAQKLGAAVGARSYSKEFELEADELGTIIAHRAGYNPLLGARYFTRIPDPGDRFLGTHPPNAARLDVVRRTATRLGAPG